MVELRKEIGHIFSVLIVLAFVAAIVEFQSLTLFGFGIMLIIFALILFVYICSKKIAAGYFQIDEESSIWGVDKYGLRKKQYFSKELPIGIILPILVLVLSLGRIPWYAVLQSDVKPSRFKSVRRGGLLSFSEISDNDLAFISASGILSVLVLSFFAYLINAPVISKLAIHFAFFNALPIGNLDGGRIFFGNKILWLFVAALTLIALAYSFFLV